MSIFQFSTNDFGRILIIYSLHLILSSTFLFIAYKILKRNKNRITIILSNFYISEGIAFILNAIYPPVKLNPLVQIIYFITAFLILLGPIFIVLFLFNLLHLNTISTLKKQIIAIILYSIIIIFILILPEGIRINENTDWRPVYSWFFLIFVYLFLTFLITIPTIILSIVSYKLFEDKALKRKFVYFIIGIIGMYFALYGLILYNTWNEQIFRALWTFMVFIIVIISGFLIYYGIGHDL